ncbi:hypothetical protein B9Z55_002903 [Caenorhabditis nigoni]|nr:hypothetical protein B9Z55_002903 [Caenorhabditis nigoni]
MIIAFSFSSRFESPETQTVRNRIPEVTVNVISFQKYPKVPSFQISVTHSPEPISDHPTRHFPHATVLSGFRLPNAKHSLPHLLKKPDFWLLQAAQKMSNTSLIFGECFRMIVYQREMFCVFFFILSS